MRVACSRCESRYEVPEEKLTRGAVRIRCTQCGHVFLAKRRSSAAPAETSGAGSAEAQFEDFDFGPFENPARPAAPASSARAAAPTPSPAVGKPEEASPFEDMELPSLGELDLGEFSGLEADLGLDEGVATLRDVEAQPERIERVSAEDLVSVAPAAVRAAPAQAIAGDAPRLDLQKGPRRLEPAGGPSPALPRDRRRSPLLWIVLVAAVLAAAYTGYNVYSRPEAFTFLDPSRIRELWKDRKIEARLGLENLQGYYRNVAGSRRFFVIRGEAVNRAAAPQGLIRVKGQIFGARGAELASREVFCGNLLSDGQLAALSREAIDARLQNQVGEALSNVDIAPKGRVPFMVVFSSPPDGIESFKVTVTAAKSGSGS